jgi:uncharacterized repeat protein (TIGR04076 family)
MTRVLASSSRIFGVCPAGHQLGDELVIEGTVVSAVKGPICYVAMSAFTDQVTQIQRGERVTSHLSCPGCCFDSGLENRVVFVLGDDEAPSRLTSRNGGRDGASENAWSLARKFSAYNWARLDGRATETSAYYCDLCWQLTQAGKYAEAEQAIEQAMKHLKPVVSEEAGI